jgi:head-tail adaptor
MNKDMDVKNQEEQSGNHASKKSVEREHRYWIGGSGIIAATFRTIYFLLKSNAIFRKVI